jgi:glycosyltransferase involved in cell wall biosynthesis
MMLVSVVISTYNPDIAMLSATVSGLKTQTLPLKDWELIIIDNNSNFDFTAKIDLNWRPGHKILKEPKQGLTFARIKGFLAAKGAIIVMVDDDNVLDPDYLATAVTILRTDDQLGAVGGKSLPRFAVTPPEWLTPFYGNLGLRDLGDEAIVEGWQGRYPGSAPIGAGMAVKKQALNAYLSKAAAHNALTTDRTGDSLSSGGDNDIVLEIIKSGWSVGYFPELVLTHIMPAGRTSFDYMGRLISSSNKSWVQLLDSHQISPWAKIPRWLVPFKKIKAWYTYKAWKNKINYLNWKGACGMYDGLTI